MRQRQCPSKPSGRPGRGARLTMVGGAVILAGIVFSAAASADDDGGAAPPGYDVAGEQATGASCAVGCHGWEPMFDGPRQPPRQWEYIVSDMIARGAMVDADQKPLIVDFLTRQWGTVWVNSAPAEDFVAVLGIPEKDADAIVAYREENGPFADLASLDKVPDIDTAAIDSQEDALTFD